jgi:ribonuclease-3
LTKKPAVFCSKSGLHFDNPRNLEIALTHRSAGTNNNERLEFLGDSILGFVIADKLYNKFPEASEGILSRLRASLVNQESLADLARSLDIGSYLIMGSGELKSGGFRRDSILSDALEAIIGALFIDQGFSKSQYWVLKIFTDKIDQLTMDNWQKDPKTQLQEFMQSRQLELPIYNLINQSGLAHSQTFEIECQISIFKEPSFGTGLSRKKAEQSAAQIMLSKLSEWKKVKP